MAKPLRSPLTGYNHNVQYLGRVFHVQTEDSGPVNPHIFTHLFFGGTILVSKKHRYEAVTPDETVRKLMQAQHKSMLRELVQAQHDERIRGFFAAKGEILPTEMPGAQPAAAMATMESQPLMASAAQTPSPVLMEGLTPGPMPSPVVVRAPVDPGLTPPPVATHTPPPVAVATHTPSPVAVATHTPPPVAVAAPQPAPARVPAASSTSPRLAPGGNRQPVSGSQPVRSPFVRSGPSVVTTSSTDGVVVQRSIVVGARPRPQEAATSGAQRPTAALRSTNTPAPQSKSARGATPSTGQHNGTSGTPAWGAAVTPPPTVRPMGALVDDKSLDEVILEYLADDGVDEGLG